MSTIKDNFLIVLKEVRRHVDEVEARLQDYEDVINNLNQQLMNETVEKNNYMNAAKQLEDRLSQTTAETDK